LAGSHRLVSFLGLVSSVDIAFQAPLDRTRCMLIGLCHDLAESVLGDIPTFAGVPKGRLRMHADERARTANSKQNVNASLKPLVFDILSR